MKKILLSIFILSLSISISSDVVEASNKNNHINRIEIEENKEEVKSGWKKAGENWYYLNNNGTIEKGWKKVEDKWYYLNENGVMVVGWRKVDKKWYYFENSGVMVIGWRKIKGNWYYLNSNGAMAIGWKKIDGDWYYLNNDGTMEIGWKKVNNKWYYLNNSGRMQTGWLKIGEKTYYLNSSGEMSSGYKKIEGKQYYFENSGVLNNAMGIVEEAKKHVGKAYISGAEGPNAFDCSGLTKYVYDKMGIKLGRTTYQQVKQGSVVSRSNLQPGDLVFSHGPVSSPGHVGIYIGNNKCINAATSRTGVIESPIYHYSTARRILE